MNKVIKITDFNLNKLNRTLKTQIGTRLAPYSKLYKKNRTSAKEIREAYKQGIVFDLQVNDMGMDEGKAASPYELKQLGYEKIKIRYNKDVDVMILEL